MHLITSILLCLAAWQAYGFQAPQAPRTFSEAKKIAWKIYEERSVDFYCGCKLKITALEMLIPK